MGATQFLRLTDPRSTPAGIEMEEVVRTLCDVQGVNGRWRIGMPVVTCTGSMVDVSVTPEGDGGMFLVSDDGLAYHEITMGGFSERSYTKVARDRCDRAGAVFDGQVMMFMRVSKAQLRGAIATMGSLIKEVIDATIEHSVRAKRDRSVEILHSRVEAAFPRARIEFGAKIAGDSTALHDFDAMVETDRGLLVFDYFSKDGNSVNSAYTKLSDIARLGGDIRPIGVTRRLDAIGPKLTLIGSVASVIEVAEPVDQYERLAA